MQIVLGIILSIVCVALFAAGFIWKRRVASEEYELFAEKENSYTLVVKGYDWGPAVPKIIVHVGEREKSFSETDIIPEKFTVSVVSVIKESGEDEIIPDCRKRPISKVYPCDIDGNPVAELYEATHLAFEFNVSPDDKYFSPFFYDVKKQRNEWKKEYSYSIASPLLDGNITAENPRFCPEADAFKKMKVNRKNRLHAAYFEPKNAGDGSKHPLIIWLHGAGEGGTDTSIVTLANKVTSLAGEKIQSYFGGAYVLCPQTPTVWMNSDKNQDDIPSPECKNKSSQYTAECKQLIDQFIKEHPVVDKKRIYVCGCSDGGDMTITLLLAYPHFFAAAAPICEGYEDSWITQNQAELLAQDHIWFTAAKDDETVETEKNAAATVQRLRDNGAKDIHFSYFDYVHDTSGSIKDKQDNAHHYLGRWSWIYFFNDECTDGTEKSVFNWMSGISLPNHSTNQTN